MADKRVYNSSGQSSSKKKHTPIVPPLVEYSRQADSQLSRKENPYKIPSKQERDAIRTRLFENWSNALALKEDVKTPIQAKLTIGAPGDKYEQEADKVAAQVVNQINAPVAQQSSQNLQREETSEEDELIMKSETSNIQREAIPEEEEEELQMKPMVQLQAGAGGMTATPDLESSIQQAKSGGQSLADNIKEPMEQAFGADFSGVKVHTDTQADQLNQSIQAKAFTTGQDVFFRQGEYNPGSRGGQELIAHELTHVVQQGSGEQLQRMPAPAGFTAPGNFVDLGNGVYGTDQVTNANEVAAVINALVATATNNGERLRIKVITGTHGDPNGNFVAEGDFYKEDLLNEGVKSSGWINVLNVKNKKRDVIKGWMQPATSAIILAWCYSQESHANIDTITSDWNNF